MILQWIGAVLVVFWGCLLLGWIVSIGKDVEKLTEAVQKQQQTLETIAELLRSSR